jgi:hypothetical protein
MEKTLAEDRTDLKFQNINIPEHTYIPEYSRI